MLCSRVRAVQPAANGAIARGLRNLLAPVPCDTRRNRSGDICAPFGRCRLRRGCCCSRSLWQACPIARPRTLRCRIWPNWSAHRWFCAARMAHPAMAMVRFIARYAPSPALLRFQAGTLPSGQNSPQAASRRASGINAARAWTRAFGNEAARRRRHSPFGPVPRAAAHGHYIVPKALPITQSAAARLRARPGLVNRFIERNP